ncbi:hypothetical protein FOC84_26385 [Achromobacter pestifer]|uniref:Lipoprotein n=1 Tax=Achromobacter pestifer TaxID=1353889 RepID=A0A7D4E0D1_9BURK|nr:hypothetical protein [Achromobacter pestifer]QKH38272.1 hypothetical protein FOC84_26385 [Achromobacter pestifer]
MARLAVRIMALVVLAGCGVGAHAGPGQAIEATGTSRSSSSSRSNTGAAIDAAQKVLSDYLRSSGQQDDALLDQGAQDRLRQQYEDAQRAAEAQARAKREADYQRDRDRIKEGYGTDPALNPWNNSAMRDKPRNVPADAPNPSASANAGPKDPGADYAGQACEYFTRPSDAAHLNYYGEGSTVVYGRRVYQCRDGRWMYRYPDTVLSARDRSRLSATQQEK